MFVAVGVGFAVHVVVPQVGELNRFGTALRHGSWWWLGVATVASALTYPAAALGILGSVTEDLPFVHTIVAQLASSAANLTAPGGLGGLALNQRYLEAQDIPRPAAMSGLTLNMTVIALFHLTAVIATSAFLGATLPDTVSLPPRRYLVDGAVAAALLTGLAAWSRPLRRRVIPPLLVALRAIPELLRQPVRATQLIASALLVNIAYIASLQAAIAAFGPTPDISHTALVYLLAAILGTITPTPGGLGGVEAALVAGLTRMGSLAGPAVAAALTFRVLTFWLPIIPGSIALGWLRTRRII